MVGRIFFFLFTFAIGLAIIKYTLNWVGWTGKSQWAEDKMGQGGTYTLWKIIAVALMIFGFLVLIGQIQLQPDSNSLQKLDQPTNDSNRL